ncbi:MAG: DUF5714 domain-containing protein [Spirochaetales bacterium]|nr:DUF5714 domain-containing protein [Spirochaetales bacterium]
MAYTLDEKIFSKIREFCLNAYDEKQTDPVKLIQKIWDNPNFPMHCPEHHVLVPAVLLTVFRTQRNDSREILERTYNWQNRGEEISCQASAVITEPAVPELEGDCSCRSLRIQHPCP